MLRRHWAAALGLVAGIPTTLYLMLGRGRLIPHGSIPWPLRHEALRWIMLVCMACALIEGLLELRRNRCSMHVLRFSVFILAAAVPALQSTMAVRALSPLATVFLVLFFVFTLLSAFDIDPRYILWETVLSALMQWELLLLLFSAWIMQSIRTMVVARGG
ncbi:MAG: hypothetical protein NTY77_00885 [Elusimicrobia bacterium]|nr:hypothetical protein [Elusimicrobiota bacterium]